MEIIGNIMAIWPIIGIVAIVALVIFSNTDIAILNRIRYSHELLFALIVIGLTVTAYHMVPRVWHVSSYIGLNMVTFGIWRIMTDPIFDSLSTITDPATKQLRNSTAVENIGVIVNILALASMIFISVYFKILG